VLARYLEVDKRAIINNLEAIQKEVDVPVMAVVKGNAYGHGAVEVSAALADAGVEWFGVEFLDEGVQIRQSGIEARILCFTGPVDRDDCRKFIKYDITPAVYNLNAATMLNDIAAQEDIMFKVHLKFDTGMRRFGFTYDELDGVIDRLKAFEHLEYEGAFTHFAAAFAKKPDYTLSQLERFNKCLDKLGAGGIKVRVRHAANSVAAMDFPQARLDMVRVGGALFGTAMFKNKSVKLKKAALLKAILIDVRDISKGAYIGYGRTYRTPKPMRIGVIPFGYFEGLKVQRRNYAFRFLDLLRILYHDIMDYLKPVPIVFKDGRPLRILGRIGLQLAVVDLSNVDARPGDEVSVAIDPVYLDDTVPRIYKYNKKRGE
jgi:alanine racemase